jgi:fructose-1,6-bisphosphatase/inositol monophosphatase family enzyme
MNVAILAKTAISAALVAGEIIQQSVNKEIEVREKTGGESYASQVVTRVDKACEKAITSHLQPSCIEFDIALLSEESPDNRSRFEKDFFWCVDPMDGTLAFINKHPGFSVSISLLAKDGTPIIGVVYDPVHNNLYHAIQGKGAYKNGVPWKLAHHNKYLTYVTDHKLVDTPQAEKIEVILQERVLQLNLKGVKEISGAGSVMNAILVLENGPACMIKFPRKKLGGGSLWDFAATACIYKELGLLATNFEGGDLDLNRKDSTFMNHEGIFYRNFGIR